MDDKIVMQEGNLEQDAMQKSCFQKMVKVE